MGFLLYDIWAAASACRRPARSTCGPHPRARRSGPSSRGFEYSDCWVDDLRLVLINALAAAEGGAAVLTRTAFTGARRVDGVWQAGLADSRTGQRRTVRARASSTRPAVGGAGAGPERGCQQPAAGASRQGSHIVTKKWWMGRSVLQHTDKRLLFINPWQDDLTLCGTTDIPYEGEPDDVAIDERESST